MVESADPARGRFRAYLLTAFKAHLSNVKRHQQAVKRGGSRKTIPIDVTAGENRYQLEPFHCETAEAEYERRWAITILEMALSKLQAEYESRDRLEQFLKLQTFLTIQSPDTSYQESADALGFHSRRPRLPFIGSANATVSC